MDDSARAEGPLDRARAFRILYTGIFVYVVLAVATIQISQSLLQGHFEREVAAATRVSPADGPVVTQIQQRLHDRVITSAWARIGGVRVTPIVLGADGRTPIFLGGATLPPPPLSDPESVFAEADRLLPAIATVTVSLPLDSLLAGAIWVGLGIIVVPILYGRYRTIALREEALLEAAMAARNASAERAVSIQTELERVRNRLAEIEPAERAHAEEISSLETERATLQDKLRELENRERELRERAASSTTLESERAALEDLLEDAVSDIEQKEREIRELQENLKQATKAAPSPAVKTKITEQLSKRLRALYPNLEVDDRAIRDMASLGNEGMRLRAEECLKKLDADVETAGARRKVGGLPPSLAIFELGFAGKGRIYYTRGKQRTFRVLAVGGKASQKTDLEYLSRLSL
jgi:predicted  nucleic acid-binding Zn-ribbon protein